MPVILESLSGERLIVDALIDTGSDITLFPGSAEVFLELRRGPAESLRWRATVGFLSRQMVYSILGTKGFFEFFTLGYDAAAGKVEIRASASASS